MYISVNHDMYISVNQFIKYQVRYSSGGGVHAIKFALAHKRCVGSTNPIKGKLLGIRF